MANSREWINGNRERLVFNKLYWKNWRKTLMKQWEPIFNALDNGIISLDATIQNIDSNVISAQYLTQHKDVGLSFAKTELQTFKSKGYIKEYKNEDYILFDNDVVDDIERLALLRGTERIVSISNTNIKTAKQIIDEQLAIGFEEGLNPKKIAKNIDKSLKTKGVSMHRWQALRIAQTETLTASNVGQAVGVKNTGLVTVKEWFTGGLSKTERHTNGGTYPDINDANSKVKGPTALYQVGNSQMAYPGDYSGSAEEVINCKCVMSYTPI